ncbi:MAG: hypothetical protein FJ387_06560 [Verrucomicrobia bacterium]|nr:hypothetical protein [Verrucomicrobiota bacterium]
MLACGRVRPELAPGEPAVDKKTVYEEVRLPRLWILDPRYDNIEVYHSGEFGRVLKQMLAGHDLLTDGDLPGFQTTIAQLFAPPSSE